MRQWRANACQKAQIGKVLSEFKQTQYRRRAVGRTGQILRMWAVAFEQSKTGLISSVIPHASTMTTSSPMMTQEHRDHGTQGTSPAVAVWPSEAAGFQLKMAL